MELRKDLVGFLIMKREIFLMANSVGHSLGEQSTLTKGIQLLDQNPDIELSN